MLIDKRTHTSSESCICIVSSVQGTCVLLTGQQNLPFREQQWRPSDAELFYTTEITETLGIKTLH